MFVSNLHNSLVMSKEEVISWRYKRLKEMLDTIPKLEDNTYYDPYTNTTFILYSYYLQVNSYQLSLLNNWGRICTFFKK